MCQVVRIGVFHLNKAEKPDSLYCMPPGAMSLKIQAVFLFFFFSIKNVHFIWIIGFSGTRDFFFLSRANSTARCR